MRTLVVLLVGSACIGAASCSSSAYLPHEMDAITTELRQTSMAGLDLEGLEQTSKSTTSSCKEGSPPQVTTQYARSAPRDTVLEQINETAVADGWEADEAFTSTEPGAASLVMTKDVAGGQLLLAVPSGVVTGDSKLIVTISVVKPNLCNGPTDSSGQP